MAVAPVGKLIWQMSIPPLISMFLQYSYNLIDSAFVARLSENALIAVSLAWNCFGHRHDDTGDVDCPPLSDADPGIVYGVGSYAFLWHLRHADHGGKLSVLRSLYYGFHLFSGYGKSRFQHGNPIMQADAFPCSRLMVSGQIVPSERNLACISGCRNCHFARCSRDDGMASPQKYLITCSREEK